MKHIHASGRHWRNCSGCRRVRHDFKDMDVCFGNATGKDLRHRTSPKGSLEVFVRGHACVFVFGEQGWDHHESGWWRRTEISSSSPFQRRITYAVPLQQPEGSQRWVFFERSLVRSLSRQQQALSLSSCKAELYGLQSVCRLVHRLLFALHEIDEPEEVVIWLESDSSSALQLVRSMDVATHWNKIALVARVDERGFVEVETQKWCWKSCRPFHQTLERESFL